MQEGKPSSTALSVAAFRAAHQVMEGGSIFKDPFALRILGDEGESLIDNVRANTVATPLRIALAIRSRFAEDALGQAVARGVRQVVVLGAGLDTFALRNPYVKEGLRVFEVDHPSTQAWKRSCLGLAKIDIPESLVFAPVDFERERLPDALKAVGFDASKPAFFYWLGVVMYIERDAVDEVFRFVASVPDAEIVFDYAEPLENWPPQRRAFIEALAARAAASGEPWITYFDPAVLAAQLRELGFGEIEDLVPSAARSRILGEPPPASGNDAGMHLMRARKR